MIEFKSDDLTDSDLSLFPNLETYKQQLQVLKSLNPYNTPLDKLLNKYFDLAVMLPQMIAFQRPEVFNPPY